MSEELALDYSYSRPPAADIIAAGYKAVLRYLSSYHPNVGDTTGKDLSIPERDYLLGAGLDLGLVWETTALRALEGFGAGHADAAAAETEASLLGAPAGTAIYYAVDGDVDPRGVRDYFQGVLSIAGRPVGVYGSVRVVDALVPSLVRYGWQTQAWSGAEISPAACLYQRVTPTRALPNQNWDEDVILKPADWGSWRQGEGDDLQPDERIWLEGIYNIAVDEQNRGTISHQEGLTLIETLQSIDHKLDRVIANTAPPGAVATPPQP